MIVTSILSIQSAFALCNSYCTDFFQGYKYAPFYNLGYLFVTFALLLHFQARKSFQIFAYSFCGS